MSEDKTKKTRRQWLFDSAAGTVSTTEAKFKVDKLTPEAEGFLRLYGFKQYLADCIASMGGTEYSNQERADVMNRRFDNLCNEKFLLTLTESGFYFKDPDAKPTTRAGGVGRSKVVQGLMDKHGWSEDKAILFWNEISGKL